MTTSAIGFCISLHYMYLSFIMLIWPCNCVCVWGGGGGGGGGGKGKVTCLKKCTV